MEPNPVQNVLRRQMGIDAYGMDRDDEVLWESWMDRPRAPLGPAGPR